jgi:hypothetical protein
MTQPKELDVRGRRYSGRNATIGEPHEEPERLA